ncbi:hypothetical protein I3842_07G230600 [Carya illinoinensis]|uniref:NADP-dependent glyceraldehyde-3-phosphate dehydrogenase n=1 Tax=Carya illinoinensis TaxID=32201 RepID=A0A922ERH3_CARIL|nr:hypothetical protein I3842_07G230600 [Carya illinoinensis]
MAVSNSAGKSKLKYDDIRDLILAEEVRRKDSGETSGLSSALNVDSRGRSHDRNSNRGRSKSKYRGKSKLRPGQQATCWNCGKAGHIKKNCKNPKKTKNDSANVVTEEVHDALLLAVHSPVDDWILDSGASFHTSSHRELMRNYVAGNFGNVYLADGEALNVVGMGDIDIALPDKNKWTLQKVRHIPELKKNLISVGQLDECGHSVVFSDSTWKITKGALVLARGKKTGTLYMTTGLIDTIATTVAESTADLWHCRLGHMSQKGMKELLSRGKLPELKSVDFSMCESCVMGKQKKVSFLKSDRTPKTRLDLVHTDVWGPSPVASLGGSRYYVTFIDDHSRKVWVYFLKHKSDVFNVFKIWKVMVETETGLKLKCLRSDNGGEYVDSGFKEYCATLGIRMEKTIPGTPQQNGFAECMNRTINERARSMRLHAGLPPTFWVDAVSTAVYLINRGPSVPLDCGLPEEVWSGKEVKFSYFKTFGCFSYVLIDSDAHNKLEAKSKKCYFIGYGDESFDYSFWDDQGRKIIRSGNVIFNEKIMYKDKASTASVVAPQESEFVRLDDLPEVTMQCRDVSDGESGSSAPIPIILQAVSEPSTPTVAVHKSVRTIRPPQRFSPTLNYILLTDGGEPQSYEETLQDENCSKWELAMKDEMDSLLGNQTWELTELPSGKKALHNKWVYRVITEHDGSKRYKARLVVKGFQQKQGIDYSEIFSPVVKITTIRMVLAMVATEDLFLEQLDVKTTFLNGDLEEDIYMHQPEGFVVQGKEGSVCRLKKSLYGLNKAPRQWYKKFDNFMHSARYIRCKADHCCYVRHFDNFYIILLLYVDDMLIAGASIDEINNLKKQMSEHFAMKDLGAAKQIFGMRIVRDRVRGTLRLSQTEYVKKVLSRFNMDKAKPVGTPLGSHFRLSKNQSPESEEEQDYMTCTQEEVNKVIDVAKSAQKSWVKTPLWKRAELLHKAAAILKEHKVPIAECLIKEIAKPAKDAVTEVVRSGDLVSYCAEEGVRILGEGKFLVSDSFPGNERTKYCLTSKVPLGVVLAIPPFNYPVNLAVSKIAPALIAGNSLVLKPPTQGAVAALHMVHCFHLAGFPKGLISCVTGKGSEIGDFLTMHPRINCISFTGGDTGIAISKKAGMIPLQMELGGKDACIILEDADLDLAAANIIKGGFSYSGQRCTAVKVVLVMESVADILVEKVKSKVAKLTVGPPEDDCDITPVVTESSANFIEGLVMDAKQKGATFCQEYKREGNLIWPLLLDNVRPDMRIAWEEPFGPVLPVIRINSVEEGIHHCNASNLGLQGCVFTRDINKAILISDAMETGTVQINSAPARGPDHFPFQGLKDSGIGSQGITNSINMMTKVKTTVINLPSPSYAMG